MPDTTTFTTRPLHPDETVSYRGEEADFVVIQRDGVDAAPAMRKDSAANWIRMQELLTERGMTPAEELVQCHIKLYSHHHDLVNNPDDHWFHCDRHGMDTPCLEAQVVEKYMARLRAVRNTLVDLHGTDKRLVEMVLNAVPRCEAVSRGDEIERCVHPAGHPPIEHVGWGGIRAEYQHEGRTVLWTSSKEKQ